MTTITAQHFRQAANIKERIDALQKELAQILGGPGEPGVIEAPKKRKISVAGIARIRAAQKARWARIKGTTPSAETAKKLKRKFTAAGKARLAASATARWAKVKQARSLAGPGPGGG
jgi:hypothetical protein